MASNYSILVDVELNTNKERLQSQLNKLSKEITFKINEDGGKGVRQTTKAIDEQTAAIKAKEKAAKEAEKAAKAAAREEEKKQKAAAKAAKEAAREAEKAQKQQEAEAKKQEEAIKKLGLSYQAANAIMRKTIQIMSNMAEESFRLDGALTEFKKVSDLSGQSLEYYLQNLTRMGATVGRTGSEMVQAATEFKKSGYSDADAATLGLIATKLQNVADGALSAGDASNYIISQLKAFNLEASESEHVVDALY